MDAAMPVPAMLGTLNVQATAVLRSRILSGELAPGSRILEIDLAAEMGVSRGTLRAALQQLAVEGLVVQKQFRSTYVISLSAQDAYEIYTLRNTLEAMAARLAAERMNDEGRAALDHAVAAMASAVRKQSRAEVLEADYEFHRCIFKLAGHSRLQSQYQLIEPQTRLHLRLFATLDYDMPCVLALHQELADALKVGDAPRAEGLAREHNTPDGERITAMLRSQESDAS
jgi:DNA-binding GntR family transcriptional regulator